MPELRSFKLRTGKSIDFVQKIAGEDYRKFGVLLLEDETEVNIYEKNYHQQMERIVDRILGAWLSGRGRYPVTWQTLVNVFRELNCKTLVDTIEMQYINY